MTEISTQNKSSIPTIPIQTAVAGTVLIGGGVLIYQVYKLFNSPGRLGQGGVSYKNEVELNKAIDNLSKSVDKTKLLKDNVYYKNVAQSAYQIMNNEMFAIDFGVLTKYTSFPKFINLFIGLNADELKQVVVEFGTRPRSFLFEFGAAGSIFDWIERMFSISQIEQLAQVFAPSNVWRTPKLKPIVDLFKSPQNKENAQRWSVWNGNFDGKNGYTEMLQQYAFPTGGNTVKINVFATLKSGENTVNAGNFYGTKSIGSFIPLSYSTPVIEITYGWLESKYGGAAFLIGILLYDVTLDNGNVLTQGDVIMLDSRYFNQSKPTEEWYKKYKVV